MNNSLNMLEVLSPAGNFESFNAALISGADAIYLGLSSFNARMKADNFNEENIFEVVKKAHLFGVKIYAVINTLIENDDFDNLSHIVSVLTTAGVDAFIVQDLGVAHFLKTCFKGIVLHASTQMGVHNLEGAKVLERLGFSRVVLSRETKLEDIKQIKQNTNLEIEYFVQGALCVAFSGNCYLSAIENNASGNEGKCLQLCRLPYTSSLSNQTKYYLSPHDLSLLENLPILIEAGVTSFKIEGRLRHAGYVATATSIYKHAITHILNNSFSKEFLNSSNEKLIETFSRGSFNTNAYLESGTPDNIIYPDYQNHIGRKIGEVVSVKPFKNDLFKVQITSSHALSSGDGLKIIDPKNKTQVASLGVGNVEKNGATYTIFTKSKFSAGLDVHLTQNAEAENKLLENKKRLCLNLKVKALAGTSLVIDVITNSNKFTFTSAEKLEKANSNPLTENDFKLSFSKLNDTDFALETLTLETDGVFAPKSMLNKIRRDLISYLEIEILKSYNVPKVTFDENALNIIKNVKIISKPKDLYIIDENFTAFENSKNYIFSPSTYSIKTLNQFEALSQTNTISLSLPTIMCGKDLEIIKKFLNSSSKKYSLFANNIGGLNFAMSGHEVIASPLINIKNNYALKCLNTLGVNTICASIEADNDFVKTNNLIAFESGNFPLMTFAHCPVKTNFGSTCSGCKYSENFTYKSNKDTYKISRKKIHLCYFELNKKLNRKISGFKLINLID